MFQEAYQPRAQTLLTIMVFTLFHDKLESEENISVYIPQRVCMTKRQFSALEKCLSLVRWWLRTCSLVREDYKF